MKRGVLYLRLRAKEQAEGGYSIGAQREAGFLYFADHNIELVDIFEDGGESARTADRPAVQRMMQFIEGDGAIDCVVVYRTDRVGRNLEDQVMIQAGLRACGVVLISITEDVDQSPTGRLMEDIIWAEFKRGSRQKGRRKQ